MGKIEIKNIKGDILFEYSTDNNSLKKTIEEVIKKDVNLSGADLSGAENTPYIPTNLPEGDFVAWKKVRGKIIKLRVLEDSLRSRATTNKCRCNKALVLEIQDLDGNKLDIKEVINKNYAECKYVVGHIVYADKWDEDRWNECSHGIHFFLDRQTAVDY